MSTLIGRDDEIIRRRILEKFSGDVIEEQDIRAWLDKWTEPDGIPACVCPCDGCRSCDGRSLD